MSFGFSVGDLIGAANLTYRLIKALHGSQDAGQEYRDAIEELGAVQQALIRVSSLGSNKNFPRATFESASCIIMGSMDIIQQFLDRTKKYDRSLGGISLPLSSGRSGFSQSWRKMGWTLFKADDMKKLREALHARLSALSVLLAAANLDADEMATRFINVPELSPTRAEAPAQIQKPGVDIKNVQQPLITTPQFQRRNLPLHTRSTTAMSIDSGIGAEIESIEEQDTSNTSSTLLLSSLSSQEFISMISSSAVREDRVREVANLLRMLISMGDSALVPDDRRQLLRILDLLCVLKTESSSLQPVLRFKDAVGREYSFPFHSCKTWKVCHTGLP